MVTDGNRDYAPLCTLSAMAMPLSSILIQGKEWKDSRAAQSADKVGWRSRIDKNKKRQNLCRFTWRELRKWLREEIDVLGNTELEECCKAKGSCLPPIFVQAHMACPSKQCDRCSLTGDTFVQNI